MKNIHVLPTEKPSRLYNNNGQLHLDSVLTTSNGHTINQNIYITSDEQLKDGDWYIYIIDGLLRQYHEAFNPSAASASYNKKIILTTDSDLIADGVQAIDNEFLEWFVKNPSCESVVVNDSKVVKEHIFDGSNDGEIVWEKKIIIPQEDPKQETFEESVNAFKKTDVYINYIKQKQERMYSEEDLLSAFEAGMMFIGEDKGSFGEWFEQFKKK